MFSLFASTTQNNILEFFNIIISFTLDNYTTFLWLEVSLLGGLIVLASASGKIAKEVLDATAKTVGIIAGSTIIYKNLKGNGNDSSTSSENDKDKDDKTNKKTDNKNSSGNNNNDSKTSK